jgi:transcriptional regulator with XRE-family HTH domain
MLLIMNKRPTSAETLIENINALLLATGMSKKELATKSGVSLRMIHFILNRDRKPSIEIADDLAKAFRLNGWQLIMPNLQADLMKNGHLQELISNYTNSSQQGRDYINRVAEQEAKYSNDKK